MFFYDLHMAIYAHVNDFYHPIKYTRSWFRYILTLIQIIIIDTLIPPEPEPMDRE